MNQAISIFLNLNIGGFRNKFAMNRYDRAFIDGDNVLDPALRGFAFLNYSSGLAPFERYYLSQTSDSATSTASIISVDEFKFAFHLPWGIFAFDTKNFPLGTGATFAENTREESIYMLVPYGPLSFRFYLFPSEPPRLTGGLGAAGANPAGAVLARDFSGWATAADGETKSERFLGLVTQYQAANLDLGIGLFNRKFHLNRGYAGARFQDNAGVVQEIVFLNFAEESYLGLIWAKWSNGRHFFNAEYAFLDSESLVTDIAPVPGFAFPTTNPFWPKFETISYHFFAEGGCLVGPAKLSLMYARSSGNVLTGDEGRLAFLGAYFANLFRPNPSQWYVPFQINYQALEPYNYLMFHTYGGGNNTFNLDGTGEMGDAEALAARLDYAVAANLNLFGSFLWARRLEKHGHYAGQFGTFDDIKGDGTQGNAFAFPARTWKTANGKGASPFVDDDFIGWEANVGLEWKLLEGLTATARYAYWQPGGWFDQAYMAVTGPGTAGNGLLVGRDAIHAVYSSLFVDF